MKGGSGGRVLTNDMVHDIDGIPRMTDVRLRLSNHYFLFLPRLLSRSPFILLAENISPNVQVA